MTALLVSSVLSFQFHHFHQHQQRHQHYSRYFPLDSTSGPTTSTFSTTDNSQSNSHSHSDSSFSDCDNSDQPSSLSTFLQSIAQLQSGSDIRGKYINHPSIGSLSSVSQIIQQYAKEHSIKSTPLLTPMAAHCLGHAFAIMLQKRTLLPHLVIAVGADPRPHGPRLSDAFCRGVLSVPNVTVVYTGIATTPAMFHFCRSNRCDGAVMTTASHLPIDRNGFKFFTKQQGGFNKHDVAQLLTLATQQVHHWYNQGIMPPTSKEGTVFCSELVDWMPHYAATLTNAILRETQGITTTATTTTTTTTTQPLAKLKIVLNSGNGSGGFFHKILQDLGADMSASLHIPPNGAFPAYIPNPESNIMVEETIRICEESQADIGIMLDTDADRCGFVVPRTITKDGHQKSDYEPLHRNRLIALLGVIFCQTSPGCTVVTDSVTSEGLTSFLQDNLGLNHVRFLKGYANVIGKARELTETGIANAELAIETSGHCAMKENGYLDDGTYTAVKVISLLAQKDPTSSLLDLIAAMKEMPETHELRMDVMDGSLQTTSDVFHMISSTVEQMTTTGSVSWVLDRENLEGVRVRIGNGGFFMLRMSLHDPLISLQLEATSRDEIRKIVIEPLLTLFRNVPGICQGLNLSVLETF